MTTISDIFKKYHHQLDYLDLELLVAHTLGKSREFVITHPEIKLSPSQISNLKSQISRRLKHEPIAYILGEKEFFGLPFKVNKSTLIPRPETEQIVDLTLNILKTKNQKLKTDIIDIGTGSGNIIISLAYNIKHKACNNFYGIDLSSDALKIAKQNARSNKVGKKIKFIQGNLLQPLFKKDLGNSIIIANLPYLSKKIYEETMPDVKNFEPKSALYSAKEGLAHYEELFSQINNFSSVNSHQFTVFLEFSPEQKVKLNKLAKKYFPQAKLKFFKDLSGKWRILEINI